MGLFGNGNKDSKKKEGNQRTDLPQTLEPEDLRKIGRAMYMKPKNPADRKRGFLYLKEAEKRGDLEAACFIGSLYLHGNEKPDKGEADEEGKKLLMKAAEHGFTQAQSILDRICLEEYFRSISSRMVGRNPKKGELVDFNGKKIQINKTGYHTPVDARLVFEKGQNKLLLEANLVPLDMKNMDNKDDIMDAVKEGIYEWDGSYEVFGGQKLQVEIRLTTDSRPYDNVYVCPIEMLTDKTVNRFRNELHFRNKDHLEKQKTLYTGSDAVRWKATSRKVICLSCKEKRYTDYKKIKNTAKHEFGHVLGLGDLYQSEAESLEGVKPGTYRELDPFYLADGMYNSVMSNPGGPVTNNDIEMVVLAFWKNAFQSFQKCKGAKPSEALGKGN